MNKQGSKKSLQRFLGPFCIGKKGMEMWQLVLIILAVLLLLFVLIWFSGLNEGVAGLLEKLGGQL